VGTMEDKRPLTHCMAEMNGAEGVYGEVATG
jgi:hypothetical protein